MSKATQTPQENGSSDQTMPEFQKIQENPDLPDKDKPDLFDKDRPDSQDRKQLPSKLTVGQFLKQSPKRPALDGLIQSLYSSKVMSFEEWEKEIAEFLKKKIK